ncbi:uncharacterized protein LOC123679295 [Harmonia axyridis]|uniref:uncharacterized protein LOC123679295 n=1 Tax=Harmonia axyridis TaxID=115357 RepID=UPI001E277B8D|nr:uncharacterized protein LOC123679295 [Harmonia axyridis]
MNSDSEVELLCTPPEIRQAANDTIQNLLPEKSQNKYKTVYKNFQDWCSNKNIKSFTENVLLAYFSELSTKYKPSSLWTFYSMLRSTLDLNNSINIENYSKLRAFLKRQSEKHVAKKAKTFTPEQLNNFINEAPDEKYLATKVALIMGIMGACRAAELHSMQITDLEDHGSIFMVNVPNTKTKIARKFTVTGNFYTIVKKYLNLRPTDISQTIFFLKFQNGKYHSHRIGINKFGAMGKDIATFLKLPDCNLYTGHCFRRSSATLLVDAGGDITALKRHGGWRSTTVAEGYIDNSEKNKADTANKIYSSITPQPVSTSTKYMQQTETETINLQNSAPHIQFNGCSNFTVNFINK